MRVDSPENYERVNLIAPSAQAADGEVSAFSQAIADRVYDPNMPAEIGLAKLNEVVAVTRVLEDMRPLRRQDAPKIKAVCDYLLTL